ncbi:MAG: phosphatidylserine decarboxylase [Phycisphaerales bacterium]|jgi:phosphatidylserine decarboxylase|nr:phosphatidylserine decarboxylase [Phycisphaerales bacterium]
MRLAPAGLREWGGGGVIALAGAAVVWWLVPVVWVAWAVTGLAALAWFCIAWFFRDPRRHPPVGVKPGDLLSPADGRVSAIERVEHHEAVEGPAVVVRIFLSVLNVHVNRMPCDAEVLETIYTPGKFLDARTAASAQVNESMLTRAVRADGLAFGVRQVSGAIARRIICPVKQGDRFTRGERFGMIKFGSTTELILPEQADAAIQVRVGDRVAGVRTVLASVPMRSSEAAGGES